MLRFLWRLVKVVLLVVALVVAIPLVGLAYGWMTTPVLEAAPLAGVEDGAPPAAIGEEIRAEVPGYQRPEESTFLTYPEWAIVYAAREYAGFVDGASESNFPYLAYIGRFWQDYAIMVRATAAYPFNAQNHLMLVVIGTSHTIEHAIQWAWENTVGRLSEAAAGWEKTPQDRFQAAAAAEYATFLDQTPWYRFPYAEKRAGLWATETAPGLAAIRSWERKLSGGLSYSIKQAYADLIAGGLAATTDGAFLDIHVWARGPVAEGLAGEPDTTIEKDLGEEGAVFVTKRYQVFTDMIPRLVERGVEFVEIGGNDEILVTVLSNDEVELPDGARAIFAYQLPAEPSLRRTGIVVAVRRLYEVMPSLTTGDVRLEHVYDY